MSKSNKVIFYAANPGTVNTSQPRPARLAIPETYRQMRTPSRLDPKFTEDLEFAPTVKACAPYRDALTAGYVQETWCDIFIQQGGDGVENIRYYSSDGSRPIMGHREGKESTLAQMAPGYVPVEFYWLSQWEAQLPSGYSMLVTQPMNRLDLPFTTSSGIVDSDVFTFGETGGTAAQIPFYIREGFSGLIPAGTPMFQLLPIKREAWQSEFRTHDDYRRPLTGPMLRRYFTGGYLRNFRQPKNYR